MSDDVVERVEGLKVVEVLEGYIQSNPLPYFVDNQIGFPGHQLIVWKNRCTNL